MKPAILLVYLLHIHESFDHLGSNEFRIFWTQFDAPVFSSLVVEGSYNYHGPFPLLHNELAHARYHFSVTHWEGQSSVHIHYFSEVRVLFEYFTFLDIVHPVFH